ncbi:MAG: zinc finger HIT domain-containing protein [Theionarchaea archaeon]|nr:zinc finger HIT domain-containing protein [Theionarchaea archaeon]
MTETSNYSCPNCGKPITEQEVFCSLECENTWLKREAAKATKEGILFCPKCGDSELKMAIPGLITIWKCPKCGYSGSLAVRDGVMRMKISEDYEREREKGENSPDGC